MFSRAQICLKKLKFLRGSRALSANATEKNSGKNFDVLIVGSGMVGSALGCALGQSKLTRHLKIGVIETARPNLSLNLPPHPSLRVSAISTGSQKLFQAIGAWELMENKRVAPYTGMRVWESEGPASMNFDAKELGVNELGYMIENDVIQMALQERLTQFPNVEFMYPIQIESIEMPPDHMATNPVVVKTKQGHTYTAKMIVGADGANSFVRNSANINTLGYSYNQMGVVASVKHPQGVINRTAWQRFLPEGPIALLPFGEYSSIVWSTTQTHAEYLMKLPSEHFAAEVDRALRAPYEAAVEKSTSTTFNPIESVKETADLLFNVLTGRNFKDVGEEVPKIESVEGQRGAFPLKLMHSTRYISNRMALIGDAAHVVHPLAGQGVNLGFSDVVVLVHAIAEGVMTGQDVGSFIMLSAYENEKKLQNMVTIGGVDGIKRIYSMNFLPIAALRNLGVLISDNVPPLKRAYQKFASGDSAMLDSVLKQMHPL
jgi:ubiquinone biosynthesis monooxygenase COQ6